MKTGDLIKNKKTGDLALVIRSRTSQAHSGAPVHEYIDFVWVDEAHDESAWSGHFEVISESR